MQHPDFPFHKIFRPLLLAFVFSAIAVSGFSQDSLLIRRWMDTLTQPGFYGRGYVNGGMAKAADYIARQLQQMEVVVERQSFQYPVNTFPGKVALSINGKALVPGKDFLVSPDAGPYKGKSAMLHIDTSAWITADTLVIVEVNDTLSWSTSPVQQDFVKFKVRKAAMPKVPRMLEATVESKWEPSFTASNVIATVPGTRMADSLLVFTAHYDHIGMMGDSALFPGANDNATGTATLLALAKKIAAQPLEYTSIFVFFGGEEAGLVGSMHFVENASLPYKQIRFLLNLDMLGDGEEGITVVNATEHPKEFEMLQSINEKEHYLSTIKSRGKSANSDHFFFTEIGVPAFFWYTMGKRKFYHDVFDEAATVPLYESNDLIALILQFAANLTHLPR